MKSPEDVKRVEEANKVTSEEELFINIGYGKIAAEDVADLLAPRTERRDTPRPPSPELREGRIESIVRKVTGQVPPAASSSTASTTCSSATPSAATPCRATRSSGSSRAGAASPCTAAGAPRRSTPIPSGASRSPGTRKAKINRPVQLRITTANRPGILATVGQTFSGQGINISEANCRASDDGRAISVFTFDCSDLAQLKTVMRALQKVEGVVGGQIACRKG